MIRSTIVLWKSPTELFNDRQALYAELRADMARETREDAFVKAVLDGDMAALADASASEIAFAKSEAKRIEPEFLGDWSLYSWHRFGELLKRDKEKWAEHDRLAERSERFCKRLGLL